MADILYPLIDQFGNHYQIRLFDNGDGSYSVANGGGIGGGGAAPYKYTVVGAAQYNLTLASSTALTVPSGATVAVVQVSGNSVNYTVDGVTPTSSVGMPLAAGQSLQFSGAALLAALRFIQTSPTATLNVSYFK